ncbi:ABC transporter ATP-binding protein [Pseudofrankia sp. DC12]|uniref:ABC transporter ATP-binding protein n=1 Tax=Pseudofrankia sp. DC12 TaxID=683315 RepID=UPI0005F87C78|nr:ABC transporter ATP-binding protein [Pseudofrankia sp. DC12]
MTAAAPAEALLKVTGLTVAFSTPQGLLRAVDGVDLHVARGETLGIVGESGSGKSATLRAIMGLLPPGTAAWSGSVLFGGRELVGLPRRELRRLWGTDLSIVLQNPMTSLNPVVRVGRQLGEVLLTASGARRGEKQRRAAELLRSVGIPEPERRLRQYPHQLSGGMRQRIAIAIAIAGDPALLLADEPTTALDVTVQKQILDLLATLRDGRHMGMIIVTHDLGVVATRTDQIIVMYAGQVVEQAPTRELFRSTRMPYTEALLRSVPRLGRKPHEPLEAIPGQPPVLTSRPAGCRFAPRCRYARQRCREAMPPLAPVAGAPRHLVRCWFPVDTAAGQAPASAALAAAPGGPGEGGS